MGGGGESSTPAPESHPAVQKLADAPILLFVSFHKAFLAELEQLRNLTESETHGTELVNELLRRFEFLKLVYKYHCAAEDEVIFLALDTHVKNVACTYSLEHRSIDEFFESIFCNLNVLVKGDEDVKKAFQELLCSVGTFQTAIHMHMLKEEKQVFPLLLQKFSPKEQASLVWQFLCSVPIALLEEFFLWMPSFLSADELSDIVLCMKEVVPKEKLLQEVVLSWLSNGSRNYDGAYTKIHEESLFQGRPINSIDLSIVDSPKKYPTQEKIEQVLQANAICNPVVGLHLWHGAIRQDLSKMLGELYQMRASDYSSLPSVIVQLKFLVDVIIFYSNTLDRVLYPVLDEVSKGSLSVSCKQLLGRSQIESLQQSIYSNDKKGTPMCKIVEKICGELDSFLKEINSNFGFLETKVFPLIGKSGSQIMQKPLLYMSFHMMPLGLLKFVIIWFSAHLSEDETNSILHCIKLGGSLVNKSLASLLIGWVRVGYSGKTSVKKFQEDLHEMFKSRCSFIPEQNKEDKGPSSLYSDEQHCESNHKLDESKTVRISGSSESNSLISGPHNAKKYDTLYSSGINMHIFSPGTLKILCPFPEFPNETSGGRSILNLEPRPLDHIFFYHKALIKDLQYLVYSSAQLAEKAGSLMDFQRRFHLLRYLYQLHSDAEDEIAFPALETKGKKVENISCSYSIDHKFEVDHFDRISMILDEMSPLDPQSLKYNHLCVKLHDLCISMQKVLCDHIHREETELWPLFRECFSVDEQEKIIGNMLGRTRAEILQEMIPWLLEALTLQERKGMISLWRKATKNTKFDEWLREWWEGGGQYGLHSVVEESNIPPSLTTNPLDVVSTYLSKQCLRDQGVPSDKNIILPQKDSAEAHVGFGHHNLADKSKLAEGEKKKYQCNECTKLFSEDENKRSNQVEDVTGQLNKPGELIELGQKFRQQEQLLTMSQEELETTIRMISRDSSLNTEKKSYMIQNLLTSRWIATQQLPHSEVVSNNVNEIPGQCPSYQDPPKPTFGCKHYKRNCKLLAPCCNQLYTCIRCHDDDSDHSIDRKTITKMMCMKCLVIQPIGPVCSTDSCDSLSMAKYYCSICKLFDDERKIYHCPYCNLCRVGKGLGIDYFHCMNCNACMSRTLSVHICREKCFEDNCPICHEYIFTSSSPIKALPCGHLMHSTCFQDYTCTQYTCPICSKSLGDMQVYFGMLDAMLAEENMPDEYSGLSQVILCNDCEKRGTAPYHWLYHKCPYCGSYNTRPL